jgi:hypothetical protein
VSKRVVLMPFISAYVSKISCFNALYQCVSKRVVLMPFISMCLKELF